MSTRDRETLDVLGIGFGPANIALAIALEEQGSLHSVRFLERRSSSAWHPDMLLDGADIQNNPLRDFVTPRNPRSQYTFVNYLHSEGRLFDYLNLGLTFPLRKDYARYIEWAARQFDDVTEYGTDVTSIEAIDGLDRGPEPLYRVGTSDGREFYARSLVIGVGRTPNVPPLFQPFLGDKVFHFTEYLRRIRSVNGSNGQSYGRICVVGGSQSAVEITLDLAKRYPWCRIANVMRCYGYRLKDTSPFSEHVYFPEFVDYFFGVSGESKAKLWDELKFTNYSAADADVINELYQKLYEQKLDGDTRVEILQSRAIERVSRRDDAIQLELREMHTGQLETTEFDAVVLATGFRNLGSGPSDDSYPGLLEPIASRLRFTPEGILSIGREYDLEARAGSEEIAPVYLNGLCESSHGFGDSGSFSLLSVRSDTIARALARRLQESLAAPLAQESSAYLVAEGVDLWD